jgi:hypothetical protein
MADDTRALEPYRGSATIASLRPFGLGLDKPRDLRLAAAALWESRDSSLQAWRLLTAGSCDDAMAGVHICPRRFADLRDHNRPTFAPSLVADVRGLSGLDGPALRAMGRIPTPLRRQPGEPGFTRISWDEALGTLEAKLDGVDPTRMAFLANTAGLTLETCHALRACAAGLGSPHVELWTPAGEVCPDAPPTVTLADIGGTDLLLIVGDGIAEAQPALLTLIAKAKRRGTRVLWVHAGEGEAMARHWAPSMPLSMLFGSQLVDDHIRVATGGELALLEGDSSRDGDWLGELLDRAHSCVSICGRLSGSTEQGDAVVATLAELHRGRASKDARHSGAISLRGKAPGPTLAAAMAGDLDLLHCVGPNLLDQGPAAAALAKVGLRVHQGTFLDRAALVPAEGVVLILPAQTRHEQRGGATLRAADGSAHFSPTVPGLPQVGEARPAWEIPCQVAVRLDPSLAQASGDRAALTPADGAELRQQMDATWAGLRGIATLNRAGDWLPCGRNAPDGLA